MNKNTSNESVTPQLDTGQLKSQRRRFLKHAVIGGAGAATFVKSAAASSEASLPAIISLLLEEPQGPEAIVLTGASTTDPVDGFRSTLVSAFLGELNAGRDRDSTGDSLSLATGDSTHCVTVTVNGDRQSVNVSVDGPDIPYGFEAVATPSDSDSINGAYYYNYQATESINYSGSSQAPVALNDNREFIVSMNGLRVEGVLDESLMSAAGRLVVEEAPSSNTSIGTNSTAMVGGSFVITDFISTGYGAFFSTQADGACSPGMGLRQSARIRQ